ncbi:hypothetical protein AX15_005813 [Amanita polypyramis BW_CC]|nr:hypothetical protein AX15_005813 [Amanita polypyramis BW_CC]
MRISLGMISRLFLVSLCSTFSTIADTTHHQQCPGSYHSAYGYYFIYIWFLAVRLRNRENHVKFITRQLLIANEGNEAVDGMTEICFDLLARYTYATADPRPANSLLADIVMNPANDGPQDVPVKEKTWVIGNAVVTVGASSRRG